jgi:hypothetical protein
MADVDIKVEAGAEEVLDQAQQDAPGQRQQMADQLEPEASTTPCVEHEPESPSDEGPSNSREGTKTGSIEATAQTVEFEVQPTTVGGSGLSASLWCPVKGRNHANLIEFGLQRCPLCKQDLKPPPDIGVSNSQAESMATDEEVSEEEESDGSQSDNHSESVQELQTKYGIQFLDNAGDHVTSRPWHGILDLETERKKMSRQTGPPVETVTVVSTSLSSEWRKHMAPSQLENLASGLLTNPNYTMEIDYMRVEIASNYIKQALREIVTYWPDSSLSPEFNFIGVPYCLFYHHWDAIKAYQRTFKGAKDYDESSGRIDSSTQKPGFKPCDEITYNHLDLLRNAIESQNLAAVLEERKRHKQSPALATFGMLWLLLKPGTTIYTKIHGKLAACVIKAFDFSPPLSLRKEWNAYRVQLWHLQYDGKVLGRHELTRYISAFEGEKRLIDLEIVPAEYYDAYDGGLLAKSLECRGERYFKLISGPRQVDYRGESLGNVAYWVRFTQKSSIRLPTNLAH